ncbi:glycosyltransferase family 2 protein [Tellurirhabdus bombi]|uniref:glycosyltransferase family 2 protein n=1 Tax=Tellurirhabdus bombi TaxID=2907205 RepID=UPI001F46CF70|nr:glycosyltransferase family 2 protein [Tellurirhabdus bombi]
MNHYPGLEQMLPAGTSSPPRVSIITAVYNANQYLDACIQSVLNQTYKNFEFIIIDGGSTDGTVDTIKKNQQHLSYWISERDKGIYDAWNKGLAAAKGDWLLFVGADDLLYPHALQSYIDHIDQHARQDLEFVSSRIELVNDDLSPIRTVGERWTWKRFRIDMITWHVGCFHSRRLFDTYGVFDPKYKICGDYELLLRPKDRLIASFVDKPTVRMRMGGVSSVQLFGAIDETYEAKVRHGVFSPMSGYLLRIIRKTKVTVNQFLGRG